MSSKYVWYSKDLLKALNALDYIHYIVKEQCDEDTFVEGRAFYYDEDKKEYGYCDFVPSDYKDCEQNYREITYEANSLLKGVVKCVNNLI